MARVRAIRRAASLLKQGVLQNSAQPSNALLPVFDIGASTSSLGARCFVTALASRNAGKLFLSLQ